MSNEYIIIYYYKRIIIIYSLGARHKLNCHVMVRNKIIYKTTRRYNKSEKVYTYTTDTRYNYIIYSNSHISYVIPDFRVNYYCFHNNFVIYYNYITEL